MKLAAILLILASSGYAHADNSITLNGRYEYRTDTESLDMLGDQVCFYPDSTSAIRLPARPFNQSPRWFCFSNHAESKRLLGIPMIRFGSCGFIGKATVEVYGYKTYRGEGDGADMATLKLVTNNLGAVAISCK